MKFGAKIETVEYYKVRRESFYRDFVVLPPHEETLTLESLRPPYHLSQPTKHGGIFMSH